MSEEVGACVDAGAFKRLAPLTIDGPEMPLPADPALSQGILPCGLRYYVKHNHKPEGRVALRLAVRVGSVHEDEAERGLAHFVEHLAFRATASFDKFELVRFLESVGASFGACQNAYTSFDETVYMLTVPTDKDGLMRQAIKVLHDWATGIRISDEDVEGERGVVLEEWRAGRNAAGRMAESHWRTLVHGSKYAERMPIGLEHVIRGADGECVRGLYRRLYQLGKMAAVVVGDFQSTDEVLAMLEAEFGSEAVMHGPQRETLLAPPSLVEVPSHEAPRISCFEDEEATSCEVLIECKHAKAVQTCTAGTLLRYIRTNLFADLLNQRLYALSKRDDAPFFTASAGNQLPCRSLESYTLTASTPDGGLIRALRTLLEEVERARRFGFSEREVAVVKANYLAELKTTYLERHQFDSSELARECCSHFLSGELIVGIEMEVRASKALLADITPADLQADAEFWNWQSSCVVKIVRPKQRCGRKPAPSEAALRAVLDEVVRDRERLAPWQPGSSRQSLSELFAAPPQPGRVLSREKNAGFETVQLSNGFTLLVKQTQLQDDELLIAGFSRGGLSELPARSYFSGVLCDLIATESGAFGCAPPELVELLAGKSVSVSTEHSLYTHRFFAECSPHDLQAALQLLNLLFTVPRRPTRSALEQIKQLLMEGVINQQRDPYARWAERVTAVNTCGHGCFRKATLWDVRSVDPTKACTIFDSSFKVPGEFTLIMVGAVDLDGALPMLEQWIASIPVPPGRNEPLSPESLTALPVRFPTGIVNERVILPMVEAASTTQITWPLALDPERPQFLQSHELGLVCKLVEARLLKRLRFADSNVYSVAVGIDFSTHCSPNPGQPARGTMQVSFSSDPHRAALTADSVLAELFLLRTEGPTQEDVSSTCEIARREHEEALQTNQYWLERLRQCAFAQRVDGSKAEKFELWEAERQLVLREMSPAGVTQVLQALLSHSNTNYSIVTLLPSSLPTCGALASAVHENLIRCAAPSW